MNFHQGESNHLLLILINGVEDDVFPEWKFDANWTWMRFLKVFEIPSNVTWDSSMAVEMVEALQLYI